MKVKLLFTALLASSFMFTACDKDDDKKPANANTGKTPALAAGNMKAKIGQIDWRSESTNTFVTNEQNMLKITGSNASYETITITIPYTTSEGTYGSSATITYVEKAIKDTPTWTTAKTGGSAKVTITSFDTASGRFSGTFSFTAVPETSTGAAHTITATEGSFTNVVVR